LPACRNGVPCRLVADFERNHDVKSRREKEPHVGQGVPDGDKLDVGLCGEIGFVSYHPDNLFDGRRRYTLFEKQMLRDIYELVASRSRRLGSWPWLRFRAIRA
jgi:hypothetical protein